jgi:hypothetical protein
MLRDRSGGAIHRAWAWRSLGSLDRYFGSACGSLESASPALDGFGQNTYMELLGELLSYVSPYAEFSRAAEQVAQEKGIYPEQIQHNGTV